MTGVIQVVTTLPTREAAEKNAAALVERRLAACAQVSGPIASTYRWKGKVERAAEWVCALKTRAERYAEVEAAIRELHPYEVPEIVALPVVEGGADYLQWVRRETEA